jgi:hypothetical protein
MFMLRKKGLAGRFGLIEITCLARGWMSLGVVAAAVMVMGGAAGPVFAQGVEELRSRYPEVKVYTPRGC